MKPIPTKCCPACFPSRRYTSVWRFAIFEFLPMPESPPPSTLLDRLDQEQDEVIRQLDALNSRIEEVLKQFEGDREPSKTASAA